MLGELLSAPKWFGRYLRDLGSFLLAPRHFLRVTSSEPDGVTAVRLVVYALTYTALEFALFYGMVLGRDIVGPLTLAGATVFEIAWSLVLAPMLWIVAIVARAENPLKLALVYALTFRFVFLTIPLTLYALFLLTEEYGFALLRGVAVYAFLLGLVLSFPMLVAHTIRRRLAAVPVSLIGLVLTWAFMSLIMLSPDVKLRKVSLLYDPIGAETDKVLGWTSEEIAERRWVLDSAQAHSLNAFVEDARFLVLGPDSGLGTSVAEVSRRLLDLRRRYEQDGMQLREDLTLEIARVSAVRDSAHFSTTRWLAEVRLADLVEQQRVLTALSKYVSAPSGRAFTELLTRSVDWLTARGDLLEATLAHYTLRAKLASMGLLEY